MRVNLGHIHICKTHSHKAINGFLTRVSIQPINVLIFSRVLDRMVGGGDTLFNKMDMWSQSSRQFRFVKKTGSKQTRE